MIIGGCTFIGSWEILLAARVSETMETSQLGRDWILRLEADICYTNSTTHGHCEGVLVYLATRMNPYRLHVALSVCMPAFLL